MIKSDYMSSGFADGSQLPTIKIDGEKYYDTGDTGYLTEDKRLIFTGRLRELINVNGQKISPSYVEDKLRETKYFLDVAVIGVASKKTGEEPIAYVVINNNQNLDYNKIHNGLESILAKHEIPREIIQINSMPILPNGKLDKKQLLEMYIKDKRQLFIFSSSLFSADRLPCKDFFFSSFSCWARLCPVSS